MNTEAFGERGRWRGWEARERDGNIWKYISTLESCRGGKKKKKMNGVAEEVGKKLR